MNQRQNLSMDEAQAQARQESKQYEEELRRKAKEAREFKKKAHEKELLDRAMKAFQEGDLRQLEQIWDELSGMDAPEDTFDDTPEGWSFLPHL